MPTEEEKAQLHQFYLSTRSLMTSKVIPAWAVQRSFEEALCGYLGDDTWLPTHVSRAALREIAEGRSTRVQRAHGVLPGLMDRYERTIKLLTEEEKPFDEWWTFYNSHDKTALITREEHGRNVQFSPGDLIEIPIQPKMFRRSGFSFRVRKKVEVVWARSMLVSI